MNLTKLTRNHQPFKHSVRQSVRIFMWNDTDIPLAFLITFRSYGTWLHGDERGSVNRFRNQYNSPRLPPEKKWLNANTQRLKKEIVVLDAGGQGYDLPDF